MKKATHLSIAIAIMVLIFMVSLVPNKAFSWPGSGHSRGTHMALNLFSPNEAIDLPIEEWNLMKISRDRQAPLYPELTELHVWYNPEEGCCDDEDLETHANWEWIKLASYMMDTYDYTMHHFWHVNDGMADCPGDIAGVNNTVETIMPIWVQALAAWQSGQLGEAYTKLGYAIHLVQDMGQPAHANDDMHPGGILDDDCLEDWMHPDGSNYDYDYNFRWFFWDSSEPICYGCPISWDRSILDVPTNNILILNDMLSADPNWAGLEELKNDDDWDILRDAGSIINQQQLFYILYYVNQTGNYFASDGADGDTCDPIGWLNGYPGFPGNELHEDCDAAKLVSIHDADGLDDNDDCDCDCDGDLSLIARWTYGTAYRATPAVINLFRRTVDNVPPETMVEMMRVDGQPIVEWNNSPVTVQLTGATDYGNPGFRASGVWKVWGLCDGMPPADENAPSWGIAEDGIHTIECLSTDMIGNIDTNDITVKFDGTPPEISFPELKPIYLTSEMFVAHWIATDALSGVASEIAFLDGDTVTKGQTIDLSLLAGLHGLEVYASDNADNMGYAFYEFEVAIDADGWSLPSRVNNKSRGAAMFCVIEFPAPYDVGLIDESTCSLQVNSIELPATNITGVGDHDGDRIPDRMLGFNKEDFLSAIAGQVGDIQVEVWGGLLPNGMPRFIADVMVSVFSPPMK